MNNTQVPNEGNFKDGLIRDAGCGYGEWLCAYDNKTVLDGIFYSVGYDDDDGGRYYRSFCPENWEKIKHMTNEEIYSQFPVNNPVN